MSAFGAVPQNIERANSDGQYQRVKVEFTISYADLYGKPENVTTTEYLSLPIAAHPLTLTLYHASCTILLYPDYAVFANVKATDGGTPFVFNRILHRNAFHTIGEAQSVVVIDSNKVPDVVHGLEGKYLPLLFTTKIGYLPVFMFDHYNLRLENPTFVRLPTSDIIRDIVHANRERTMYTNNERLQKFLKERLPEYQDKMSDELKSLIKWRSRR
jgi:hypothetical protein